MPNERNKNSVIFYFKNSSKPLVVSTDNIDRDGFQKVRKSVEEDKIFSIQTEKDALVIRGSDLSGVMFSFTDESINILDSETDTENVVESNEENKTANDIENLNQSEDGEIIIENDS